MFLIKKFVTLSGMACLCLMLSACGPDYTTEVLGTWKDVNKERYLSIEKHVAPEPGYSVVVYEPVKAADEGADEAAKHAQASVAMNHRSLPASMRDGILMIELEAGDIPVLYDSINQLVVLNGTDEYQRVHQDITQLELASVRAINH